MLPMTTNKWIAGARPRTLPAAIAPVFVGTALRHTDHSRVDLINALLALLVSLTLQVGVNYANDYSDGIRGTDEVRVGPIRLVGSGLASAQSVRNAALITFTFAGVFGLILSARSSWWLIPVGAISIVAAWFYTGGNNPYGYRGLGEISVFLFFGVVGTVGSYFVQSHALTWQSFLVAIPVGSLACALLAVNNLRDLPKDSLVNKRTLAVRLGDRRARIFLISLITAAHLASLATMLISPWSAATLLLLPTSLRIARGIWAGAKGAELIPFLGDIGKLHLLVSSTLALALLAKR
jgi:1,4-dihydroxy-2-naphthoate polyprenyltransferase